MAAVAASKPHHLKLFFSNRYCRAQIVRILDGTIVADACSWEPKAKEQLQSTSDKVAAAKVGELVARRAAQKQVTQVAWIRKQGQRYHGKIAALIESMQASGLPLH